MVCPICNARKGKRFCPAKVESICSLCCGTEREVTIDCPTDCSFLIESRDYEFRRRTFDRKQLPFCDTEIPQSFLVENEKLLAGLSYAICRFARNQPRLVDSDVIDSTRALAETHRTLQSGLYYEQPPTSALQRELYETLDSSLKTFQKEESQQQGIIRNRTRDFEQILIFLTQLGTVRSNGRSRSRAFLDFLRGNFKDYDLGPRTSSIVLPD